MPRASWKGFLRLSLASCPVYLAPATTRTKAVRFLRQVWGRERATASPIRPTKPMSMRARHSRGPAADGTRLC
jgi:non-homologous end joining protein Ku